MKRTLQKLVFVEPKSTHLHIYSRICIPRLGSILLATIDQGPVFEPFAKVGLLFTKNLDRIREAYKQAAAAEGLWEAA